MSDTPTLPAVRPVLPTSRPNMSGVDDDRRLIELWLDGKSKRTQEEYLADVITAFAVTGCSIRTMTLDALVRYRQWMVTQGHAPSSIARRLSAIKSLLSFAQRTGYHSFDVGVAIKLPKRKAVTVKKLLSREEVRHLIAATAKHSCPSVAKRNELMCMAMYGLGLRAGELVRLTWGDLRDGQCVIEHSKGDKTRTIHVNPDLWQQLEAFKPSEAGPSEPVFASTQSRRDGTRRLSRVQVTRVVKAAAKAAGLGSEVSAHWLRHAHASHALEAGAPLHELQATLGHASIATTSVYLHARQDRSSSDFLDLKPR